MPIVLEVSKQENFYLTECLQKEIDKLNQIDAGYITHEIDSIRKLVFAFYGKSYNSFTGWRTVAPYHINTENKNIAKELAESHKYKRTNRDKKNTIFKIYDSICNQINERLRITTDEYKEMNNEIDKQFQDSWPNLIKSLATMGIKNVNESTLKKIIADLTQSHF